MSEHLDEAMKVWQAGLDPHQAIAGASTSQRCAFAIASGVGSLLPKPYDSPGRAWLRLDDGQRNAVHRWNPTGASYAERTAHKALAEGVGNHGSALPSPRF